MKRDVDPGQHPHGALAEPLLERGERVGGARHRVLAAGRVVVDDLDGVVREQRLDVGPGGVDDRQPVGRRAVRAARDVRLHRLAAAVHERQRVLEPERAERVQRGELADAVARGDRSAHRRRLRPAARRAARRRARRSAGCVNSVRNRTPLGWRHDAPVREPQLARVALDDVEQVEPERARACARRRAPRPHARRASARALRRRGPGAGCPGRGRRARSAAGRRSPRRARRRSPPRARARRSRAARRRRRPAWPRSPGSRRARRARGT